MCRKTRNKAYAAVRDQLSKGHQAYVVAPSIDEDENLNSAMKLYNELKEKFAASRSASSTDGWEKTRRKK